MKYLSTVMSAILTMVVIMSFGTIGPEIETRFFPVYTKFAVKSIERGVGGDSTTVVFRYSKLRDCVSLGSAWYLRTPDSDLGPNRPLDYSVLYPPGHTTNSRPIGRHESRPMVFATNPEEFMAQANGDIHSRCHPFWLSKTTIFP